MHSYVLVLLLGAVLSALLYCVQLKKNGLNPWAALAALLLGSGLGLVCAKAGYCLLLPGVTLGRYGVSALFHTDFTEFSFVAGVAGICLGAALGARLCRLPVIPAMNAFAPALALWAAAARFGEYFLEWVGYGKYVDQPWQQFFPLSVESPYGGWYTAVFMLEGLCALVLAAVLWLTGRRGGKCLFARCVFYLALPQIFWESLRALSMKWGFVRVEQVLCGIIVTAVVAWHCLKGVRSGLRRFLPVGGMLLCIAVMVGVEFALDKTNISYLICYGVMILALLAMAALEMYSARQRKG